MGEAEFLALVERIEAVEENISRLGAGIIVALSFGIAKDSRSFARLLGVAHALVLREIVVLGREGGYIRIERREARTQRVHYLLSAKGSRLLENLSL